MLGQFIDHHFRRAKNDAELDVLQIDQAAQHVELRAAVHLVIDLLDRRHGQRLRLDRHVHRILREGLDQLLDRPRHRGGKENRLPLGRRLLQDRPDVVEKAHVEHPVGLVEDDHLHLVHLQRAALEVVHTRPGVPMMICAPSRRPRNWRS